MDKIRKYLLLIVSLLSLTISVVGISFNSTQAADMTTWLLCEAPWGEDVKDVTKEIQQYRVTEKLPYLVSSKASVAKSEGTINIYNSLLEFSGYKFGNENKSSINSPFDIFGMRGIQYTSYIGEWKYYNIDGCKTSKTNTDSGDYGEYYEGRLDPLTSYAERRASKDPRVQQLVNNKYVLSFKTLIANILLSINKFVVSIGLALIGFSFGDVADILGITDDVVNTTFSSLYSNFFIPLQFLMILLTGIYMLYYGIIKREYRTTVIGGILKPLGALVIAIIFMTHKTAITWPNKFATLGQTVIMETLGHTVTSKGSDDFCKSSVGLDKLSDPTKMLESAGSSMRSVLGCRLWKEFIFKPWVKGQWNTDYNKLETLGNINEKWVLKPEVKLGETNTITNWALFQQSVQSGYHTPVDNNWSGYVNGLDKDWYRIVDALSNYDEIVIDYGEGGSSSSGGSASSSGGGDGEWFLSQEKQEENAKKIYSVMKTWGLNDYQIAGMLGNFERESNLNPEMIESGWTGYAKPNIKDLAREHGPVVEKLFNVDPYTMIARAGGSPAGYKCTDGHCAGVGLGQWTAQPTLVMRDWAKKEGLDLLHLDFQLAWMLSNVSVPGNNDASYHKRLVTYSGIEVNSPGKAAEWFLKRWEYACGECAFGDDNAVVHLPARIANAEKWYNKLKNWKVDEAYAKKVISMAKNTIDPGSIDGGGSSISSSSRGGKFKVVKQVESEPLDAWKYWTGNVQGERFTQAFIGLIFSIVGMSAPIVLSAVAAALGVGITLLTMVAPIFLLFGLWGGKGNEILMNYVGLLFSTVTKKILASFLVVISVTFTSNIMDLINTIGMFKALVYMTIVSLILINKREEILNTLGKINMGTMNLGGFMKGVRMITKTAKTATTGTITMAAGAYGAAKHGASGKEIYKAGLAGGANYILNQLQTTEAGRKLNSIYELQRKDKHHEKTCPLCQERYKEGERVVFNEDGLKMHFHCAMDSYPDQVYNWEDGYIDNTFKDEELRFSKVVEIPIPNNPGKKERVSHPSYHDMYQAGVGRGSSVDKNKVFALARKSIKKAEHDEELMLKYLKRNGVERNRFSDVQIPDFLESYIDSNVIHNIRTEGTKEDIKTFSEEIQSAWIKYYQANIENLDEETLAKKIGGN